MSMNKRGQLFIVAAVVFILVLFMLTIRYNTIREYEALEDFEDTAENYAGEYAKVYNLALYEGNVPEEKVKEFTETFVEETRKSDPNYGVFYVFKDTGGKVHILNTLNKKVLDIEVKDEKEVEKLTLFSENSESTGEICIAPGSCQTTTTRVSNFGDQYTGDAELGKASELLIKIQGQAFPIIVPLEKFTAFSYQTSSRTERISDVGDADIVEVFLTEY